MSEKRKEPFDILISFRCQDSQLQVWIEKATSLGIQENNISLTVRELLNRIVRGKRR